MNEKNNAIIVSPDTPQNIILIIAEATTKVKEAIVLGQDVKAIIDEYTAKIEDIRLRAETYNALVLSAKKWEYETKMSIMIFARGNPNVSFQGFRSFLDSARTGVPVIKDYKKQVGIAIKALSAEPPKVVTTKNGKAYTMSLRNRAEMQVRYDANLKGIEDLKAKGVELVWISSHANASPRCANHQGKLYSINPDKKTGVANNIRYTYLPDVLKLNNGNSILSGYNCRHRAVEYVSGSKPPNDYNEQEIKKEYAIDLKQRSYENSLRQMKTEERLLRATKDDEFVKKADILKKRIRLLQKEYEIYSLKNNRSFDRWRAAIAKNE